MQDAVDELERVYQASGLVKLLRKSWNEVREMGGREFAKLQFESNDWLLSSIEIWPTKKGRYFRIHYSEKISPSLKQTINALPGSSSREADTRVGASIDGDPLVIAANLAGALQATRICTTH